MAVKITPTFDPLRVDNFNTLNLRSSEAKDLNGTNARISSLENQLIAYAQKNAELQRKIVEGFNNNQALLNKQKQEITNGVTQETTTTVINRISSGGGGGSSTGSTVTVSSQSLTAGVATSIVFSQPAELVALPDCYATIDGLFTLVTYDFTSAEPISFTITPVQDCTIKYAYRLL